MSFCCCVAVSSLLVSVILILSKFPILTLHVQFLRFVNYIETYVHILGLFVAFESRRLKHYEISLGLYSRYINTRAYLIYVSYAGNKGVEKTT